MRLALVLLLLVLIFVILSALVVVLILIFVLVVLFVLLVVLLVLVVALVLHNAYSFFVFWNYVLIMPYFIRFYAYLDCEIATQDDRAARTGRKQK